MQSMTLQACTCKGGGEQRIKCHWRHVARASLDIEKDIIRLKKCLHRETKDEPRHGASGLPNVNFRVIAVDNRCRGKLRWERFPVPGRVQVVLTDIECHSSRINSQQGSTSPSPFKINYSSKMTATV